MKDKIVCKICNENGNGYCAIHSTSGLEYKETMTTKTKKICNCLCHLAPGLYDTTEMEKMKKKCRHCNPKQKMTNKIKGKRKGFEKNTDKLMDWAYKLLKKLK